MGQKQGAAMPISGELGPRLTQCGLGKVYFCTKWHLDPSSHLATTDMGRKMGAYTPFRGELGHHLTQRCLGQGLVPY